MAKVSSEAVNSAAQLCKKAVEKLQSINQALQSKYQAAGSGWNDAKYKELGGILSECKAALNKPIDGLQHCQETLGQVAQAIADYESVNLH